MAQTIHDLADFYKKWPELRNLAISVKDKHSLKENERIVMNWMILMLDRISPADFSPNQEEAE